MRQMMYPDCKTAHNEKLFCYTEVQSAEYHYSFFYLNICQCLCIFYFKFVIQENKMVLEPNVSPHKQIAKDDDVKVCISNEEIEN